jgi:hypothetical protein
VKIPAAHADRETFYQELIVKAFASRPARVALYDTLKNWFLWGNPDHTEPVEYNKLAAHIDLLASFLFAGETTSFVIEVSEDAETEPDFELQKAAKVTPAINKAWNRSNLDLIFNEALVWALVYNTMFVKLVQRPGGFDSYTVEPHQIGVLLEHEPMIDQQPVIVHEFFITKSDLERRIQGLPAEEQTAILALCKPMVTNGNSTAVPASGTERLILAASSPNMQGNALTPQNSNLASIYDFDAEVNEDGCTAQEVWVWDDDRADYRVALMLESDYLLIDYDKNLFIEGEQPFIKVCPNPLYNYFWGRTELMYLIPLQKWVNERIPEIKKHLQKQTNPPRAASGFQGYADEKAFAVLDNPGGTIFEISPSGAKLDKLLPENIQVFDVLDRIEMMFAEVSGIRELMQGKGESGVRAMSHANLLVRVGSSRVKKKAAILEDAVEKIGDLVFKLIKKYDATKYKTEKGMAFIAAQISDNAIVKVDSHSSSPIFVEQQIDKATILFKAGAIDREDLIDAMKIQNPGAIKRKLKKREEAAALARIAELKAEAEKTSPKGATP